MIGHLHGHVALRSAEPGRSDAVRVVVDVGGVGYLTLVPTGATVPSVGEPVQLHTSLQVREDSMTLYGFTTAEGRDLFEALLAATGVGPRLALAALSTLAPDALRRAVAEGDLDALSTIPGVGRKSAQRLVLELRDRLGAPRTDDEVISTSSASGPVIDARLALLELGYSNAEAHRALERVTANGNGGEDDAHDVGELVRAALRSLATSDR